MSETGHGVPGDVPLFYQFVRSLMVRDDPVLHCCRDVILGIYSKKYICRFYPVLLILRAPCVKISAVNYFFREHLKGLI